MNIEQIDVIIESDGQVRIEVRGVAGEACLELTRELEQSLGGQVVVRQMTPDALLARQEMEADQQLSSGQAAGASPPGLS
jgi:hypothetical protein